VQIPTNLIDPFSKSMSGKGEEIRALFLEHIKDRVIKAPVKVMLGDGTVSHQESFDPEMIRQFYNSILKKLPDWMCDGISVTTDQDLRRSFIKFEVKESKYILSVHMSLQYHVLLFYKLDHGVIDAQKELSEISDKIKNLQENIAPENDKIIEEKLRQKGYEGMDQQKLFEVLFEHDDLTQELTKHLQPNQEKISNLIERRDILFRELDNMLIEVYHTVPVLIDEMKMIAAEEGCLCIFNLEHLKNNSREGNLDPVRIPPMIKDSLLRRMDEIKNALKM
jgi:hypothetical protein